MKIEKLTAQHLEGLRSPGKQTEDGTRIRGNEGSHQIFEEKYRAATNQSIREATLEDYLGNNAMDVIEADRQINEQFSHNEIKRTQHSTRNHEFEIEHDEARIRLHLLNVVKVVKEDRKYRRKTNNLEEELENTTMREW